METVSSRCSWMVTVLPANVLRNRVLSICHSRSRMATVLFLPTTRSVCAETPVQVGPPRPPKYRAFLCRRHVKFVVIFRDVPPLAGGAKDRLSGSVEGVFDVVPIQDLDGLGTIPWRCSRSRRSHRRGPRHDQSVRFALETVAGG